jgi:hypothetical protein
MVLMTTSDSSRRIENLPSSLLGVRRSDSREGLGELAVSCKAEVAEPVKVKGHIVSLRSETGPKKRFLGSSAFEYRAVSSGDTLTDGIRI